MKQAIVFGAGNIGRGFIGQLFSESGYHVTFADIDKTLLDALNSRGWYTIRLVTNDQTEAVEVGPVAALHSADTEAVADVVARAEIGATAVGAGILKHIAPVVARGLARRAETGNRQPFNLILCENLHGAAEIFRGMVLSHLPESLHAFVAEHVGFVDTVIARMVPPLTPELRAADPSLILVEPYKELPVDKEAFVGPVPAIVNMIPYAPFAFFTERKLYIHNAGHATLGYLGYLKGYEYGYEALADEEIYFQARGAMEESALALTRKYHPSKGALLANIDDLLHRFGNRALGDTILRLGRDPLRKLARGDRLAGAALNCLEQGVAPVNIVTGLAAGLRFDHPGDPLAQELQARIQANGIERTLEEVTGIAPGEKLGKMILERYADLANHQPIKDFKTTQLTPDAAGRFAGALRTIYDRAQPAVPWRDGENLPWDEPTFSERMLKEHLEQSHGAASRKMPEIRAMVQIMREWLGLRKGSRLLDVTCGPGLYAAEFAKRGVAVTGIDFGPAAVRYAREHCAGLPVEIHQGDVRAMDFAGADFDAAVYLYGQFTVLRPEESLDVLRRIRAALRPGAPLLLEILDDARIDKKNSTWWYTDQGGLWGDFPYLHLGERVWDAERHAIVERFYILNLETGGLDSYGLSDQAYTAEMLREMLAVAGFKNMAVHPSWDNLALGDAPEWCVYIAEAS